MTDTPQDDLPQPLVEGIDYYLEEGKFVFTASYHLRRGHCCESGCRHCPYGFSKSDHPPSPNDEKKAPQ